MLGGVAGALSASLPYVAASVRAEEALKKANLARAEAQYTGEQTAANLQTLHTARDAYEAVQGSTAAADALGAKSGVQSAGTYLVGSVFSTMASGAGVHSDGEITSDDLTSTLQTLFSNARDQLAELGNLAVGGGGNYGFLPNQPGMVIPYITSIGGFFGDGKWLLGDDTAFNGIITGAYNTFKVNLAICS